MTFSVAILTVSDRCSRGETTDTAGPALAQALHETLQARVIATACVPDHRDEIAQQLTSWARSDDAPALILTTGGTGLSPRDNTPEATLDVLERHHPGFVELIRATCGKANPWAYLSRAQAGTIAGSLVINLPGSQRGALESLAAVSQLLPHAVGVLTGQSTNCGETKQGSRSIT